jgi:hypothetical protein
MSAFGRKADPMDRSADVRFWTAAMATTARSLTPEADFLKNLKVISAATQQLILPIRIPP